LPESLHPPDEPRGLAGRAGAEGGVGAGRCFANRPQRGTRLKQESGRASVCGGHARVPSGTARGRSFESARPAKLAASRNAASRAPRRPRVLVVDLIARHGPTRASLPAPSSRARPAAPSPPG